VLVVELGEDGATVVVVVLVVVVLVVVVLVVEEVLLVDDGVLASTPLPLAATTGTTSAPTNIMPIAVERVVTRGMVILRVSGQPPEAGTQR